LGFGFLNVILRHFPFFYIFLLLFYLLLTLLIVGDLPDNNHIINFLIVGDLPDNNLNINFLIVGDLPDNNFYKKTVKTAIKCNKRNITFKNPNPKTQNK
jgi:hypothetical protein